MPVRQQRSPRTRLTLRKMPNAHVRHVRATDTLLFAWKHTRFKLLVTVVFVVVLLRHDMSSCTYAGFVCLIRFELEPIAVVWEGWPGGALVGVGEVCARLAVRGVAGRAPVHLPRPPDSVPGAIHGICRRQTSTAVLLASWPLCRTEVISLSCFAVCFFSIGSCFPLGRMLLVWMR